jgi:hypothetical protein
LSTPIDPRKYNLHRTAKKLEERRLEVQIQHPSTTTKPLKPSLITCPVRSGVSAASLAATGLGERTGHAFMVPTTTKSLKNQRRKEVDTITFEFQNNDVYC